MHAFSVPPSRVISLACNPSLIERLIERLVAVHRFDALDRDGSGMIDLHEFIRFSLRDALARAHARVADLLKEWDADSSGEVSKKEFRRSRA